MEETVSFWSNRVKESGVLNPVDRISEVLFGLIMVLTFTGAISASNQDQQELKELLWAALGCNLAWGLVDANWYLMNIMIERGHSFTLIDALKKTNNKQESNQLLRSEIQPLIAALMDDKEMNMLSEKLKLLPKPSNKHLLTIHDFKSALFIFLLVFLCTFPVAIPFILFDEVAIALKASNGVALILLFICGYILAKYAGFKPLLTALAYTLIGVLLVSITYALGG